MKKSIFIKEVARISQEFVTGTVLFILKDGKQFIAKGDIEIIEEEFFCEYGFETYSESLNIH